MSMSPPPVNKKEICVNSSYYGINGNTTGDCVALFQNMFADIQNQSSSGLTTRVKIQKGNYNFNVTGDSTSIALPDNCIIDWEPGSNLYWGYWGSPLFHKANGNNTIFEGNGLNIIWNGTYDPSIGTGYRGAFGYNRAIPVYEWCAHLAIVGSNNITLRGINCAGATTANIQNDFITMRGNADGSLTTGNIIENILANDIQLGINFGEQKNFIIRDISGYRYYGYFTLYGPGHLIYMIEGVGKTLDGTSDIFAQAPTSDGILENIRDYARTSLGSYQPGAHALSMKYCNNVRVRGLYSERAEGILNIMDSANLDIELRWMDSSADLTDVNGGAVYFISPNPSNLSWIPNVTANNCKISGSLISKNSRNISPFNMAGLTSPTHVADCEFDLEIERAISGSESSAAVSWVGNNSRLRLKHNNTGTGSKSVLNFTTIASTGNDFNIKLKGHSSRVVANMASATATNNKIVAEFEQGVFSDAFEFTPAYGNTLQISALPKYSTSHANSSGSNPGFTFTLPASGTYIVNIELRSSDKANAMLGTYLVSFDNLTSGFQSAQLIGSQVSKGAGAPSVLSLTVSTAGTCTVTSTAASNTWVLQYGYDMINSI